MPENRKEISMEPVPEIRIERLNADKTRKDIGTDSVYHVYFELSAHPPSEWRDIFGREWKAVNTTQEAGIDGGFLVLHCPLQEVVTKQLPALKRAVAAANAAYKLFAQTEATARGHREDVWREERKEVDDLAASLHFE